MPANFVGLLVESGPLVAVRYPLVMNGPTDELVTVFRSADSSAAEDAEEVRDLLAEAGLNPVLAGDDAPGVPSGAWEVRVPPSEAARADAVMAASSTAPAVDGDPSPDLDPETVFDGMGATAEMEAIGVRGVLDANGISSVLVGARVYPNLRFLVRVSRKDAARARQALADARAAGPAAAEEAATGSIEPPQE
ncbi:MAG: hypothetical protein KIT09_06185 [Bryobacteraceae bacterium]|nr:hypothetical protein [Bryobacteraceae bacterium]